MKAHRTHSAPPVIEPLGLHDEFFYNFNIVESPLEDEDGNPTEIKQYHYDQVRGVLPANEQEIIAELVKEGYKESDFEGLPKN